MLPMYKSQLHGIFYRIQKMKPLLYSLFVVTLWGTYSVQAAEPTTAVKATEQSHTQKYAEKGVIELSGRTSVAYSASASSTRLKLSLSPGLNYFIRNNWYLGTALSISYEKYDSDIETYPNLTWSTGFSPSALLGYANSLSEKWYWFIEAGITYGRYNCNYCGGSFSQNQLYTNGGLKYDVGNGLIAFGMNLNQNSQGRTTVELFLGLSVYF